MTKLEDWITCCHSVKVLKSAGIDSIEQLSLLSYEELLNIMSPWNWTSSSEKKVNMVE